MESQVQQIFFMELKYILEALLFTSQKPLSVPELRDILTRAADEEGADEAARALRKLPLEQLEAALAGLAAEHESAARSFRLVCVAGSWQFVTRPDHAPWLRAFLGVKNRPARLSQPALETLAIVAYRQPITRAEIEQIRGVAVDGVMATLKERGLIVEAGRAEVIGRPMQFATGPGFLEYFGLADLQALPSADELRRIPVQRPESLLTVDPHLATAPSEPGTTAVPPALEGTPPEEAAAGPEGRGREPSSSAPETPAVDAPRTFPPEA
ncbi:MAG: SMC-Scp complex subunit ScpB [Verrucomicrobiota bacterium]